MSTTRKKYRMIQSTTFINDNEIELSDLEGGENQLTKTRTLRQAAECLLGLELRRYSIASYN